MNRTIIRRFDPWNEFRAMQNELQRMVQSGLNRIPNVRGGIVAFVPALDVVQTQDNIIVRADVPGCRREDLQITFENQTLTIRGTKSRSEDNQENGHAKHERLFGEFERSIALPVIVDSENATAHYADGVLTVVMPKRPEARPRTISIAENAPSN
jgi:HSP20 family protein